MYNLKQKIEDAFRNRDLRCTSQRYFVMEHLVRHPAHPTAEEICAAANRTDPRSSRATVYNNLNALTRAGLVREVACDGGAARFDANVDPHHHFVCDACGAVEDVPWFDAPSIGRPVRDFEATFRGVCELCRSGKRKKKR